MDPVVVSSPPPPPPPPMPSSSSSSSKPPLPRFNASIAKYPQQGSVQAKSAFGIYTAILLTRKIRIPFQIIGRNVKDTLEHILSKMVEGKCMAEGFIRPGSVKILTYSNGYLHGKNAIFEVVYECESCSLVEGVVFSCVIKNISLAGIRATLNEPKSPVVVFIARDHHYDRADFTRLQEEEEIRVRVIGQRFEIGDDAISVIAELV
jgi:DNA-directed RNA polymerase subunit E'/Rpb7